MWRVRRATLCIGRRLAPLERVAHRAVQRVANRAVHLAMAAALLALWPTAVRAQQTRRLEPILAELLRPDTRAALLRRAVIDPLSPPETQPAGGTLAIQRSSSGVEPIVGVFIKVRSSAGLAEIRALGGDIGTTIGEYTTARVPLSALPALAASASIASVEAARALRLDNDSSTRSIRADEVRTLVNGQWQGATGAGAIVGVYDTGIDFGHGDFRDEQGNTRLLGLWDQTRTGRPPSGFSTGTHCTPTEIQQAIDSGGIGGCTQRDTNGHGTHVAGSAAGDGSAGALTKAAYPYAGVAPGADLLIVNGGPGIFFENMIIEGLTWMRQEGLRLGRPIVVNLSLGGQFGAHDGSRLYERMIDALSGPGFIVVISAGNNGVNRNTSPVVGGTLFHARGLPIGSQTVEVGFDVAPYVPASDPCNGNFLNLSLWYESVDELTIEVVRPGGTTVSANRGVRTTGESATGRVFIDNGADGVNPENGDVEVMISVNGCGTSGAPGAGSWRVRVTPAKTGSQLPFDLWIYSSTGIPWAGATGFDNRFVVGSPGTARRAITVGAFVTRLCWPSAASSNAICYTQREALGDLARFSSAGPTRDGRIKPEIAAPGLGVLSSNSANAIVAQQRVAPDGVHAAREGTSMAAPHVAGTVAILLAGNPQLTPEDVRAILAGSARRDVFTSRVYDTSSGAAPIDWWGFGKLDVPGALLAMSDGSAATLTLAGSPAAPATEILGSSGSRVPLLLLRFEARGFESIDVTAIGFDVKGNDPGARLLLLRDNGNARVDPADVVIGSLTLPLSPAGQRAIIRPDSLRVPPFLPTPVFLAVEMSGRAPNGATFEATLVPSELHSVGVNSGAIDRIEPAIVAVASGPAGTTVLEGGERLTFSANPVREDHVVFNFSRAPAAAAVYTITGRRIADLCRVSQLQCGSATGQTFTRWELRNDDGQRVAPGVYLLIFDVDGITFRQKLMILTPVSVPDGPRPQS